jgi:hypothetical protein
MNIAACPLALTAQIGASVGSGILPTPQRRCREPGFAFLDNTWLGDALPLLLAT